MVDAIAPEGTKATLIWESDHPETASVDNGTVIAKSNGSAVITGKTQDDLYQDTCTINVTTPVNSISIDEGESLSLSLASDSSGRQLNVTFDPSTASNKEITWRSDDNLKAIVSNGLVTPVAITESPVNITATSVDGSKTDSIAITVTE